jgi:hypothetical protein
MAQYSELSHFIFKCKNRYKRAVQIRLHFRVLRKETEPFSFEHFSFSALTLVVSIDVKFD